MKPYKLPRRVKGKRTNKLQIMLHGGSMVYRQGSLELEERNNNRFWLSVIPPAKDSHWWPHTWDVPRAPELVMLAFLAKYKNHAWDELLGIKDGLVRVFEPFEKGGY